MHRWWDSIYIDVKQYKVLNGKRRYPDPDRQRSCQISRESLVASALIMARIKGCRPMCAVNETLGTATAGYLPAKRPR